MCIILVNLYLFFFSVIQSKSGGNPGWIDSFLTTLMQGRNLVIRNIDYRKMHTTGLVAPPLYMMHRLSEEDANLWKCIMEEKSYDYSIMKGFRDDWHFFIDCCRDSFTNVTIRQQIDSALMKDVFLPVCFLEKNFNAADIDAEASVDTTILTTFDSLNYDEQLLLKCSSVLGDSFPRAMLAYILGNPNPRHMALAVRTLFEIKVLCCGQGDFMDGANYVVIRNKMEDPLKRLNMNCGCEGLNVTDDCYDLPKYANCGYLRFRSSYFRETTYNLLTVAQQKEFHTKAAKYLMTETRKCRGCGSTFFNFKLLSGVDEGLMKKRKTRKERRRGKSLDRAFFTEFDEQIGSPQGQSVSSGRQSVSVATAALYMKRRSTVVLQPYAPTDPEDEEETSFVLPVRNGLRTINHLKDSYSLTKTYSHLDLSQCECNRILNSLYSMLVNHYTGSSQWRLLLGALISYARFCIATNNIAKAIILVNQGIKFLQTSGKDTGLPNWAIPIEEAKCYTLFGICLYHLGQHDDAFNKFKIAIAKYGYPFPGTKVGSIFKLTSKRLRQKFGMYLAPDGFRKEIDSETHISNNNVSECLVWLSKLYMIKGKTKLAELAAIWSLNVCLETQSNISRICEAFSNMILFCCQNNKLHYTIALEVHSLRYLHKKRGEPNSEEAFSIATLYSTIFVARKHRNELDKALHIGYIYVRMNIALKNFESATSLMPTLINILVEKLYLTEAISLVNELQFYVTETYESTGRARFYCAAMQFHLETGYSVVSFSECLQFYQTQGLDMSLLKDSCLKLQYIVCMWLWHLRNEKWEEASAWTDIIESDTVTFILMLNKIMFRVSNIIYQMEGILHLLNNNINTLNNDGIQKMKKKFLAILPLGYKALYYSPFWTGRYYHLKAYYYHLLNNESKARHYLDYAVKISNKMGLALETQFLEHTDKAWSEELPKNIKNLWKTRCNPDNLLDVNDMTANTKLAFYTYTTPMYL